MQPCALYQLLFDIRKQSCDPCDPVSDNNVLSVGDDGLKYPLSTPMKVWKCHAGNPMGG